MTKKYFQFFHITMALKFLLVVFVCICVYGSPENRRDAFELTRKGLTEYLSTGKRPLYLDYALKNFQLPHLFRSNASPQVFDDGICILCELVAEVLIQQRKLGMSDVQLGAEAYYFCTALGIENQRVCDGLVNLNVEIFGYIIDNNANVNGQKVCSLLLQSSSCSKGNNYEWTIEVPAGETIDKLRATGSKTFNVLQISDIHYDPLYTPGKSSKCGEPLCCQIDQINGNDKADTCGYWADYTDADIPLHTVHESLSQASSTHSFDYVYYTGDFVSHRVWSTSIESNTKDIITISDLFRSYFNVPVYPILGNHEPHPLNVWASDGETDKKLSTQWLFDLVADQWSGWLTEEARQTILKGGYYTISPREGFRIVALNSNVCYIVNWWLINEDRDPYGQLAWLVEVLTSAENSNESVHILSHIPTGESSCLQVWSREYSKIVERFANTITAQFNGHTHKDQFSIYYTSSNPKRAINTAWNGASITTYSDSNPSYKLFQIDDETFVPLLTVEVCTVLHDSSCIYHRVNCYIGQGLDGLLLRKKCIDIYISGQIDTLTLTVTERRHTENIKLSILQDIVTKYITLGKRISQQKYVCYIYQDVLDYEEWTFNLTLANLFPYQAVPWYKLYSFKDAYGVNSLQPSQLDRLVYRMTEDHALIDKYQNYKYRNSDVVVKTVCDESCHKDILCEITTTVHGVTDVCQGFQVLYDENK